MLEGKTVAHVVVSDRVWGAVRVALSLAKHQAKKMRVWIAINEDLAPIIDIPEGCRFFAIQLSLRKSWSSIGSKFLKISEFRRSACILERAYHRYGWDVIHFHLPNAYLLSLFCLSSLKKVFTVHGPLFENPCLMKAEPMFGYLPLYSSVVSTISRYAISAKWLKSKAMLIPNGVEPDEVIKLALDRSNLNFVKLAQLRQNGSCFPLLLYPGNLVLRKGYLVLIKTLPLLIKRYPKVLLVLPGDGADRQKLMLEARRMGVDKNVLFLGYVDNVYPYLRIADIIFSHLSKDYLLPSLVDLEALVLGKALITHFTKEKHDLYGNDVYFIKDEDERTVFEKITCVIEEDSPELAEKRKERAKRLSWHDITNRYDLLYEKALKGS